MRELPAYEHHGWPKVVEFFEWLAIENRYFVPMREFVNRLAASPYASGLYPMQSMHTPILSQNEQVHVYQDRVAVTFEDGEFVVRHRGGPTSAEWTQLAPAANRARSSTPVGEGVPIMASTPCRSGTG